MPTFEHQPHTFTDLSRAMAPRSKSSKAASSSGDVAAAHADLTRAGRTRKQRTKQVGAHASARVGLISGLIEGTMAIMELMFGLTMSRAACLTVYRTVNSLPEGQDVSTNKASAVGSQRADLSARKKRY